MQYYIQICDKAFGPLEEAQLSHLLELRKIDEDTLISTDTQNWQRLDSFSAFAEVEPLEVLPLSENSSQEPAPQWYYSLDGTGTSGPFPIDELIQMAQSGFLRPDSIVWKEGESESRLVKDEPAFANIFPPSNNEGKSHLGFLKRFMHFRSNN